MIFWGSFLLLPMMGVCVFLVFRLHDAGRWISILALIISLPVAWGRFVEPHLLFVHRETIDVSGSQAADGTVRIALFSDTHFGIFRNAISMQRIVNRIRKENIDAVFIAGDFLYNLPSQQIARVLAPLGEINVPVFAVLGNHDVGLPGPFYGNALYRALRDINVKIVENRSHEITLDDHAIIVAGASELWRGQQSFSFRTTLPENVPVLLLVHNPDTALRTPDNFNYDLMLAGHTHGGQINLPFPGLMRQIIPTYYPFTKGLHHVQVGNMKQARRVYVTPGTGMVGLPMRFLCPPRIDVLTLVMPRTP